MGREVRIPVRVVRPSESKMTRPADEPAILPNGQPAGTPPRSRTSNSHRDLKIESTPERQEAAGEEYRQAVEAAKTDPVTPDEPQGQLAEWRDRALRLQADMENYRKRQQRAAQDQIRQERSRLLNAFLEVVDDLERALAAPAAGGELSHAEGLQRGVELTHRAALQLLEKEGAEAFKAKGQPFDPSWHEAVATVPRNGHGVEPGTVLEVVEPGYRIQDELLRPAKVVVAV